MSQLPQSTKIASLSLERWWQTPQAAPHHAVRRDIAQRIARALMSQSVQRVALYFDGMGDDFDAFIGAFVGSLLARKTVVLLPNVQPDFLAGIRAGFDLLLTDRNDISNAQTFNAQTVAALIDGQATSDGAVIDAAALQNGKLEIFTSGSTGEPKRIDKSLAQLEAEVRALETLWGETVGAATIVSTVSHQHIYGLLFRVLWPLLTQREIVRDVFQYPEPLLQQLLALPHAVLVSSPAQLKRMPDLVDMATLSGGRLRAIFSSGGRLDNRTALAVLNASGTPVTEVLGSTETGGVAWRCQQSEFDRTLWQPLPGVTVRVEGEADALVVNSPFIGNVDGDGFVMGDRARLGANGSFELLERLDAIVKVEGKRVALTEIAARLTASPLVAEAAAVLLQSGQRDSIGAAVVLSAAGREQQTKGRRALNEMLRAWLADYFEAVVLPKKWRYVDALPINAQGKLTQAALLELFEEQPRPTLPQVLSQQLSSPQGGVSELRLQLLMPPDLFYFQGHFPERPILPGVVQIAWAMHFGRELFIEKLPFKALEAIKFQSFVVPQQQVTLTLSWSAEKAKLTFSYQSDKGAHSSGRIVLQKNDVLQTNDALQKNAGAAP